MIDFLPTFIAFFAVIDPIGTIPVFIAVTHRFDDGQRRKIALLATIVSALILVFFALAGEYILRAMGISLAAFQIAGGLVLFIFAMSMIFGESKPEEEVKLAKTHKDTAIFPLAVPSIAGPGAMLAAVLMTDDARMPMIEQFQVIAIMLLVLLVTYGFMRWSGGINRVIGTSGASVISRVMGLLLAAIATTNTLNGIKIYFHLV